MTFRDKQEQVSAHGGGVTLLYRLRRDLLSARFPRAVLTAWLLTTIIVLYCFAIAGTIFNGPLHPFATNGAGMLLFGSAVYCLLVGLSSGYHGALAVPQDISAAVLGTMAATVAAGTAQAPDATAFLTMTALVIVSSLVTGLVFVAIGHFRLSNLFRFIPYPVTAGFFAGTGWIISLAALALMSGMALDWETLPRFLDAENLWKWGPGMAYGLVLAFVMKRTNSIAILFGSLVGVIVLFHIILLLLGLPVEDAGARGLMLSGTSENGLWPQFGPSDFAHIDGGVVVGHLPSVLAVAMVMLLCMLVNTNGLEVATGVKVDLNREFRAAGFAGMVAGVGGSAPGAHSIALSLMSRKMGADTPWTGILTFLALSLTLFFGSTILEVMPKLVVGGLLLFLGVDLLDNWLFAIRRRLHWTDYSIVVLIALIIAVVGFVEGIAVGLFLALALFAVRLSRVEVVEASLTGRESVQPQGSFRSRSGHSPRTGGPDPDLPATRLHLFWQRPPAGRSTRGAFRRFSSTLVHRARLHGDPRFRLLVDRHPGRVFANRVLERDAARHLRRPRPFPLGVDAHSPVRRRARYSVRTRSGSGP